MDSPNLNQKEQEERENILYLWYHHAISNAIKKKNKEKAIYFAEQALNYQPKDSTNKITKLLYLILTGNLEEADKYIQEIEGYQKETAETLLKESKSWF